MKQISEDPHICSVATQTPNPGLSALPQPYSRCAHHNIYPNRLSLEANRVTWLPSASAVTCCTFFNQETFVRISPVRRMQARSFCPLSNFLITAHDTKSDFDDERKAILMTNVDSPAQLTYINWR
jgi:hypothetical protein